MALLYFVIMDNIGFNLYNSGSASILFFLIFYFFVLPLLIVKFNKIDCIHNIFCSSPFVLGLTVSYVGLMAFAVIYFDFLHIVNWWLAGALHNPLILFMLYLSEKNKKTYSKIKSISIFIGSVCICSLLLIDMALVSPLLFMFAGVSLIGLGGR